MTAECGDPVGGGASRRLGGAAEEVGDLGVGQPTEVVVGDSEALLVGERGEGGEQFGMRIGLGGWWVDPRLRPSATAGVTGRDRRRSPDGGRSSPARPRRWRRPAATGRPSTPTGRSRTMRRRPRRRRGRRDRPAAPSARGPARRLRTVACQSCPEDDPATRNVRSPVVVTAREETHRLDHGARRLRSHVWGTPAPRTARPTSSAVTGRRRSCARRWPTPPSGSPWCTSTVPGAAAGRRCCSGSPARAPERADVVWCRGGVDVENPVISAPPTVAASCSSTTPTHWPPIPPRRCATWSTAPRTRTPPNR